MMNYYVNSLIMQSGCILKDINITLKKITKMP